VSALGEWEVVLVSEVLPDFLWSPADGQVALSHSSSSYRCLVARRNEMENISLDDLHLYGNSFHELEMFLTKISYIK